MNNLAATALVTTVLMSLATCSAIAPVMAEAQGSYVVMGHVLRDGVEIAHGKYHHAPFASKEACETFLAEDQDAKEAAKQAGVTLSTRLGTAVEMTNKCEVTPDDGSI